MGFNRIILEGRLTKDVILNYSQSGMAMAKGNIAVSKKFTKNGETKEKTLFVNLQFWGRSAEIFNQYCRKGSRLLIEGELENSNWTDNNGNKKYDFIVNVSTMQMLDSKGDNQAPASDAPQQQYQQQAQSYQAPQQQQQQSFSQPQQQQQSYQAPEQQMPSSNSVPVIDIDEDEIPFNQGDAKPSSN